MLLHLRALKVTAFTVMALVIVLGAEASQVLAESFQAADENRMVAMINDHRAAVGLPDVVVNDALRMIARRHTRDMATSGDLYHNPDLKAELNSSIPGWSYSGENVGVGPSTDAVQEAFIESAPHRQNIETRRFNVVGVGGMSLSDGRWYFTQNFADYRPAAKPKPAAPAPAKATPPPAKPAPAPTVKPAPTVAPKPVAAPVEDPAPGSQDQPTPSVLGAGSDARDPAPEPQDPSLLDVLEAIVQAVFRRIALWS